MRKCAGKISFVLLAAIVSLLLIATLFLFNTSSPSTVAAEFMSALAKRDAATLTKLSIVGNKGPEEIRKQWETSLAFGKHYLFAWKIVGAENSGDSSAAVRLSLLRNPVRQNSYDENFQLVLIKTDQGWKVDVPQISREMFPNLPK